MPQDSTRSSDIPLDDEDILELTTVVAKPADGGDAVTADGPPEPGGEDDFGADLDALLNSLTEGGSPADTESASPASTPVPAVGRAPEAATAAEPVAAPIADQTPVIYAVDANEEMPMPETADIDSLLAELGAGPKDQAAATAPAAPPVVPAPPQGEPEAVSSVGKDDFESILAMAEAASAQKPAGTSAPSAPAPATPAGDDARAMPGNDAVAAPANPVPEVRETRASAVPVEDLPEAPAAARPGTPVPEAEAAPSVAAGIPAPAGDPGSLDLNELDALIDDIVATAPEIQAPAASAPEIIAVPDDAIMPAPAADPALTARLDALEEALQALQDAVPSSSVMTEEAASALVDEKLAALREPSSPALSVESVGALVDEKLAALLEPGSPALDTIAAAVAESVLARLTEGGASSPVAEALRRDMEKMTAAAAAKVIREEIAALLDAEGGKG